jgi:hypothetical protein
MHTTTLCIRPQEPFLTLFCWTSRDIRGPFTAFNPGSNIPPDIESWLLSHRDDFAQACIALERVRQATRRDRKASARVHSHEAGGDLVKLSTRILPFLVLPAQTPKLLFLWLGPFKVIEHDARGAYRIQ